VPASPLFEIARLLVCFNHVAPFVVKANHGVPIRLAKLARFLQNSAHMKTTTLPLRNSRNRSPLPAFLLIPFVLGCFALSPQARAVCQQGCSGSFNSNAFLGEGALASNTTGNNNTATGDGALGINTTGFSNTANGASALIFNTTGYYNTATGAFALFSNTTSTLNTATGVSALYNNTTGDSNTAIGASALINNTTGSSNIALGGQNLTTGSNNIDIGNAGVAGESKTIRIGTSGTQTKTFIAGISGVTVSGGVGVIVGTNGKLGTVVSSERFKDAIKPMDKASEVILALKPVTFRYKHELDPEGIPQFGLVAEDVEKVNPNLVARDADGKAYTVRYEAVNAMLLNEFLKEHRKVESLEKAMAEQQKENESMRAMLKEQAAQIQKVSEQLEASRGAQQTVVSNP
jgi:hypothetical protein